jgi:lysophospholipase L1-like esterase
MGMSTAFRVRRGLARRGLRRVAVPLAVLLAGCGPSSTSDTGPDGSAEKDATAGDVAQGDSQTGPEGSAEKDATVAQGDSGGGSPADAGPPAVRRIGRFDLTNPGEPSAEWSASSMEARFTGTSVSAQIGGNGNYFAALVDGTLGPTIVTDGSSSYPVASGLSAGAHQVSVFRRDEAFDEPSQLIGFTFDASGALLPPPGTPTRRIELIGDSISAGYGDECTNAGMGFSAATENEYIAYGPLTARALAADIHVVAWSGKGMYQNLDGTTTETMPILWQRTLPTDATSAWNPQDWIPDAVVINLGTNDYGAPGGDPSAMFQATYLQFVTTLRSAYPAAYIFCALGPLLDGTSLTAAQGAIDNVIAMRQAAGDAQIALVQFPTQNCLADGSGCGCDYHPSAATHQAMAAVLEGAIHTALSW